MYMYSCVDIYICMTSTWFFVADLPPLTLPGCLLAQELKMSQMGLEIDVTDERGARGEEIWVTGSWFGICLFFYVSMFVP